MKHDIASKTLPNGSDVLPKSATVIMHPAARSQPPAVRPASKLTKAAVSKLTCPAGQAEAFFWDPECKGLGLRIFTTGRKVWVAQYRDANGRTRRTKLGRADLLDPAEARALARELLARVAKGGNPSVERKAARKATTVASIVDAYLAHAEKEQRPRSFEETRRNLRKSAAPLHHETAAGVDRGAIARLHARLGEEVGRVQANRTLAALSAMWAWCLRTGFVDGDNPCAHVPKFAETARERVLSRDELRLIWQATGGGGSHDRIVRILMLTACRRQEVGGMRWDEIEGDLWTVAGSRMKRGRAHEVALSPLTMAQLPARNESDCVFSDSGSGFSGWSAGMARLNARITKARIDTGIAANDAPLAPWGLHDLRRTFSTMAHDAGAADPHVIEAVLAHAGAQSGVAGVYNKASYREQKRAVLLWWADVVHGVVEAGET